MSMKTQEQTWTAEQELARYRAQKEQNQKSISSQYFNEWQAQRLAEIDLESHKNKLEMIRKGLI